MNYNIRDVVGWNHADQTTAQDATNLIWRRLRYTCRTRRIARRTGYPWGRGEDDSRNRLLQSTVETLLTHTYRERPYGMGFRRIWVTWISAR